MSEKITASIVHFADGGSIIVNAADGSLIGFLPVDESKHYMAVPLDQYERFLAFVKQEEAKP